MVGKIIFKIAFLTSLILGNAWAQTAPVARVAVSVGEAKNSPRPGKLSNCWWALLLWRATASVQGLTV